MHIILVHSDIPFAFLRSESFFEEFFPFILTLTKEHPTIRLKLIGTRSCEELLTCLVRYISADAEFLYPSITQFPELLNKLMKKIFTHTHTEL